MTVYIAGPMTGVQDKNRERFAAAEEYLTAKGHTVLNPAWLPDGMPREKYMPICLMMLEAADAIYMLRGWKYSDGANIEALYAAYQGKEVMWEYDRAGA